METCFAMAGEPSEQRDGGIIEDNEESECDDGNDEDGAEFNGKKMGRSPKSVGSSSGNRVQRSYTEIATISLLCKPEVIL